MHGPVGTLCGVVLQEAGSAWRSFFAATANMTEDGQWAHDTSDLLEAAETFVKVCSSEGWQDVES